jgi:hypothetical protein
MSVMPRYLSRTLIALLVGLALSGWGLAANLGLRVLPAAGATPAEIATAAGEYLRTRILLASGGARLEQLEPLVTGEIAEALDGLGAVVPDRISLVGEPTAETIWRVGERALVELRYLVSIGGGNQPAGELVMMELIEGRWRASRSWQVAAEDD